MELKYVKNIQFTRLIKCDGQLKEFNFRKPNGKQEGLFTVDVIDASAKRIIFNMEMNDLVWTIIDKESLPIWITESELAFHEIIDEEFKSV
ncbi:MAG: hypothetical protein IPL84_13310 [Chitinophagaceae bacterium]|nr:hypothetical protein [Chitinophagaceae bacterium]